MLIHDIDNPDIYHDNSLAYDVRDYKDSEKFDVIMMNPPYGGKETDGIKINFPADLRSSETADLFMSLIMYRLREDGRAAVVLPDGFMFGTDNVKMNIKQKLINEFNLHTIIRLPASVFAPYTSITTNILFFDKTHPTETTWFYRLDMPEDYKHFSKTKPMKLEHLDEVRDWWNERLDIEDATTGHPKAKAYSRDEIIANNYNLDLVGFPNIEEEILSPEDTIREYKEKRASLNAEIDQKLAEIEDLLGIKL